MCTRSGCRLFLFSSPFPVLFSPAYSLPSRAKVAATRSPPCQVLTHLACRLDSTFSSATTLQRLILPLPVHFLFWSVASATVRCELSLVWVVDDGRRRQQARYARASVPACRSGDKQAGRDAPHNTYVHTDANTQVSIDEARSLTCFRNAANQ
ncbi:uncharacterized protein J3D65DRAFT_629378 [Phyllosticta citribraziliensis]|uniref:Secreted protein n=1 Tax=Phyllosticta citribraziliensis TaxID=989973 RepID=A0ABR1LI62_9PEZI